jgi:hypothetical protein
VDTDLKTIIFFGAGLLVILIMGILTERKRSDEEAGGRESY